jgi:hypothetical protein
MVNMWIHILVDGEMPVKERVSFQSTKIIHLSRRLSRAELDRTPHLALAQRRRSKLHDIIKVSANRI